MSAFSDIQDKQQRGEPLMSLEFAVWWCSDVVAARKAAEELAALRERVESLEAFIDEVANDTYDRVSGGIKESARKLQVPK